MITESINNNKTKPWENVNKKAINNNNNEKFEEIKFQS